MFSYLKNKDIVRKLGFTAIVLAAFRLVAAIPIPGIPQDALKNLLQGNNFFQVISLLSGGLLRDIGLLTIGLGPYINASYIFQLLSVIVPQVKELYQGGPVERKMLTMYTRLLAVPLSIIQAVVIFTVLQKLNLLGTVPSQLQVVSMIVLLTFGAMFAMWLGELITEFGLGGGSSVIILAGILVSVPLQLSTDIADIGLVWKKALLVGLLLVLVVLAIIISLAVRKVKLIYARRVRPTGEGGVTNYIPLSINSAGVMPVIFAISMLDVPRMFLPFVATQLKNSTFQNVTNAIVGFLSNQYYYDGLLLVITIFFAFLSAYIVFKPEEVAENINKQGAFIEGVRPGKETEKYLNKTLWTTTLYGAILLGVITAIPSVVTQQFSLPQQVISGTGSIILAAVIMDVIRQVQSMHLAGQTTKKYY